MHAQNGLVIMFLFSHYTHNVFLEQLSMQMRTTFPNSFFLHSILEKYGQRHEAHAPTPNGIRLKQIADLCS